MTKINSRTAQTALVGWLIAISAISYLLSLAIETSRIFPALFAWAAVVICWLEMSRSARRQSAFLLVSGVLMTVWPWLLGAALDWQALLARNMALLTMFVAVSFLAMANPQEQAPHQPKGRKGIWSTLLTCHLLGSVINLSIVFVVGDRLAGAKRLSASQVQIIMRSFCAAAFWSPFFVAIGVALIYAPGARWQQTFLPGTLMALPMFGLTYWDALRRDGDDFEGYPISHESLIMPLFLAVAVLTGHWIIPSISILTLISLLAPAGAWLFMKERPRLSQTRDFIQQRLANVSSQFALFLTAGVFSTGISSVIVCYPDVLVLEFSKFTPLLFWILSGGMIIIALVGVHPVVSIALVSPFLTPLDANPNQLAFMFLTVWGISTACSPLSGIGLAMTSRYHVSSREILTLHRHYMLLMWLLAGVLNILWFG